MSAIEYGTTYWGVILQGLDPNSPGETVHLHADAIKIDPSGALTFTSVGRRPAGTWPAGLPAPTDAAVKPNGAEGAQPHNGAPSQPAKTDSEHAGSQQTGANDAKTPKTDATPGTIYVAFAPGTWKTVYAAKLQDGAPASIEHWSTLDGKQTMPELNPVNSGASGQPNPL